MSQDNDSWKSDIYNKMRSQYLKLCRWKMWYSFTVLLCLVAIVAYFCIPNHVEGTEATKNSEWILEKYKKDVKFDYLRFTQQWPPAICEDPATQHCAIPNNTNFWTIHGLWPDTWNTSDSPSFCNNSWHFNQSDILPIQDELLSMWPDLIDGKMAKTFWKHEWSKHGTCSSSMPTLNSILKYFTEGLQLREQYNLIVFLSKMGIEPSDTVPRTFLDISNALKSNLGSGARVMCSFKKLKNVKKSQVLLSEVQICIDKNFQPFDCPNSNSTNCPKSGIFYIPIATAK